MNSRPTQKNTLLEQGISSATTTKHGNDHNPLTTESKAFSTLQAKFAQAGHAFYRTVNPDGSILYLASKWGMFRELKTIEVAAAFLVTIGGAV